MKMNIHIGQGLGNVRFGMHKEEVLALLGSPMSTDLIDEVDNAQTEVLYYQAPSIALFFAGEGETLSCIDVSSDDAILFGKYISDMEKHAVIGLMKEAGYKEYEEEVEDWGEHRVSFPEANVDFFFEDDMLLSVNIGV